LYLATKSKFEWYLVGFPHPYNFRKTPLFILSIKIFKFGHGPHKVLLFDLDGKATKILLLEILSFLLDVVDPSEN
jgi:hypothetical protein